MGLLDAIAQAKADLADMRDPQAVIDQLRAELAASREREARIGVRWND